MQHHDGQTSRNDFERAFDDLHSVPGFRNSIPEDVYRARDNFWRGYQRTDEPASWSIIEPQGFQSFFGNASGEAQQRGIWGVTRGEIAVDVEGLIKTGMDYLDNLPSGPSLQPIPPESMNLPADGWQTQRRLRRIHCVMDTWALYIPIHDDRQHWGIYLFEHGIWEFASWLWPWYTKEFPHDPWAALMVVELCIEALLRHELEHHKFEAFALQAELHLERPVYREYARRVYEATYPEVENLEEGLANNAVLRSAAIDYIVQQRCPKISRGKFIWRDWMRQVFDFQAPAYTNYELRKGLPAVSGESLSYGRQSALRALCNQILQGTLTPTRMRAFDAFSPDGHANRFERQVPLYVMPAARPAPPILVPRKAISGMILSNTAL